MVMVLAVTPGPVMLAVPPAPVVVFDEFAAVVAEDPEVPEDVVVDDEAAPVVVVPLPDLLLLPHAAKPSAKMAASAATRRTPI